MIRGLTMAVVWTGCQGEDTSAPQLRARPTQAPAWAEEILPDVYSLGADVDPVTGQEIEGVMIVDRVGDGHDDAVPLDVTAKKSCWKSIGFGGWSTVENWGLDATNSSGLADADVQATLEDAIDGWEVVISSATDVFGVYDSSFSGVPSVFSDGENNIAFGNAGGGGIVAVTYLWSAGGSIVEWDQIYEDTFDWNIGDPVPATDFDFLNVAAHEVGHAAGLNHPAGAGCQQETMYAFVNTGESKKRTLNNGDINGINKEYP